jgi:uncharacterized protein DUF222/HNH endonuclease
VIRPAGAVAYEHMFVRSELSREELERELRQQAAHVDAALCRLTELAAECEERLDWGSDGVTFAGWLAWQCSLMPRVAREHERIGKRLVELPMIRAAFARGELSYAKVSALTRVAEPATEEGLLELAEALTVSQLARCLAAYRRVSATEAAETQEREFLDCFWSEEGWLSLRGRLAAEEGAVFLRALEAARDVLWERRRAEQPAVASAEPHGSFADAVRVSNTEALVALAELAVARPDGDRTGAERYQVVVHVDAETLAADAEGRCALDEGPPLAAETARRLACDASVVELREQKDGSVLSLGRKRRTVSPALRRALAARDRCCRFPGCDRTRFVDAHHVRHWSRGGETSLENLVLLCRRHHRLVHERGYTLQAAADGSVEFRNQHGIVIPNVPPRSPPSSSGTVRDQHLRHGLAIDAGTCRNGVGDRMDLELAVDAIVSIAG